MESHFSLDRWLMALELSCRPALLAVICPSGSSHVQLSSVLALWHARADGRVGPTMGASPTAGEWWNNAEGAVPSFTRCWITDRFRFHLPRCWSAGEGPPVMIPLTSAATDQTAGVGTRGEDPCVQGRVDDPAPGIYPGVHRDLPRTGGRGRAMSQPCRLRSSRSRGPVLCSIQIKHRAADPCHADADVHHVDTGSTGIIWI